MKKILIFFFFFSSRRRHTRLQGDWSSDVCSSDLSNAASDDERILIDHAGRRETYRLPLRIAAEIEAKIDAPVVAERRNGCSIPCIKCIDVLVHGSEHSFVTAGGPIHHTAVRAPPRDLRIKRPEVFSGIGFQGERLVRRRIRIEDSVHNNRLGLQTTRLTRVVSPRDRELRNVCPIDLLETRVPCLLRVPAIRRPLLLFSLSEKEQRERSTGCNR